SHNVSRSGNFSEYKTRRELGAAGVRAVGKSAGSVAGAQASYRSQHARCRRVGLGVHNGVADPVEGIEYFEVQKHLIVLVKRENFGKPRVDSLHAVDRDALAR